MKVLTKKEITELRGGYSPKDILDNAERAYRITKVVIDTTTFVGREAIERVDSNIRDSRGRVDTRDRADRARERREERLREARERREDRASDRNR